MYVVRKDEEERERSHLLNNRIQKLCNCFRIVAEKSVKYVPPDGFTDIQILQAVDARRRRGHSEK